MHGNLRRRIAVVLGMLCLLVPFGAGAASATSATYTAPSLPWSASMSICIGGEICGRYDTVTVNVPSPSYITYVRVYAHDNVGDKRGARLHLYLDGVERGDKDVLSAGGWIVFPLSVRGSQIVFRSTNSEGTYSGDETVIQQISVSNS